MDNTTFLLTLAAAGIIIWVFSEQLDTLNQFKNAVQENVKSIDTFDID